MTLVPTEASMREVFAALYNANAGGLVNDRWLAARDLLCGSNADRASRRKAMLGFLRQHRVPPRSRTAVICYSMSAHGVTARSARCRSND
jgi:hypothetical protein